MVKVISHGYSPGNGAGIKNGPRNAAGESWYAFMKMASTTLAASAGRLKEIDTDYDTMVRTRRLCISAFVFSWIGNRLCTKPVIVRYGHPIANLIGDIRAAGAMHFRSDLCLLLTSFPAR
jgi:hypothetical protein